MFWSYFRENNKKKLFEIKFVENFSRNTKTHVFFLIVTGGVCIVISVFVLSAFNSTYSPKKNVGEHLKIPIKNKIKKGCFTVGLLYCNISMVNLGGGGRHRLLKTRSQYSDSKNI